MGLGSAADRPRCFVGSVTTRSCSSLWRKAGRNSLKILFKGLNPQAYGLRNPSGQTTRVEDFAASDDKAHGSADRTVRFGQDRSA